MIKKPLLPLTLLCLCVLLFGCGQEPTEPKREFSKPTHSTAPATEPVTEPIAEAALLPDGYYLLYQDMASPNMVYMHLQDQAGELYMMNVPVAVTLQEGKLCADGAEGMEYTYNSKILTLQHSGTEIVLKYIGPALPEEHKPVMPPAGTYAVSSVGENGNVQFYSQVTEEVLTLSQDGTGSFFFAGQQYDILLQGSTLTVNGKPIGFSYTVLSEEEAMLMFLWPNEGADSIVLRPIMVP